MVATAAILKFVTVNLYMDELCWDFGEDRFDLLYSLSNIANQTEQIISYNFWYNSQLVNNLMSEAKNIHHTSPNQVKWSSHGRWWKYMLVSTSQFTDILSFQIHILSNMHKMFKHVITVISPKDLSEDLSDLIRSLKISHCSNELWGARMTLIHRMVESELFKDDGE